MKTLVLAALFCAAGAQAAPSIEAAKSAPFGQTAAVARFARRPRWGTVKGGFGGAPVDLTLDRIEWTLKGGVNGAPVDLKIDHENAKITGGAGGKPVALDFAWSPEKIVYTGFGGYTLDWQAKTLKGDGVDLAFDMEAGTVKGGAWGHPVDLTVDATTGHMTGGMNGAPVDCTLVNLGLGELLEYFFVLRK
jgi:hypothetical protein